jgi:hypothetical protein
VEGSDVPKGRRASVEPDWDGRPDSAGEAAHFAKFHRKEPDALILQGLRACGAWSTLASSSGETHARRYENKRF